MPRCAVAGLKLADLGLAPHDLAGQPDGASVAQAPPMTRAPPRSTPRPLDRADAMALDQHVSAERRCPAGASPPGADG
jgi:hypothetical protein